MSAPPHPLVLRQSQRVTFGRGETERMRQRELWGREVEASQLRAGLLARLEEEDEEELADRLRKCGLKFPLWCRDCGHRHEAATKCNRKWCPSCAPKRANERVAKMRIACGAMKWPMHVTFTIKNIEHENAGWNFIRHLGLSFARLRRMKLWKQNVKGGIYGIEVTNTGHGWHPHIHSLIDCRWLALNTPSPHWSDDAETVRMKIASSLSEVDAAWCRATGQTEPPSVKLRRCNAGAIVEILKYAVKGSDLLNSPDPIGRVLRWMDSRQLTSPFGSLRGLKLPDPPPSELKCPNGHQNWSPSPPFGVGIIATARQSLAETRAAEFETAMARILAEEEARVI